MFSDQTVIDYMNLSLTLDVTLTVGFILLVMGLIIYDKIKRFIEKGKANVTRN